MLRTALAIAVAATLAACATSPEKGQNAYFEPAAADGVLHRSERCGDKDLLERLAGGIRFFAAARAAGADSVSIHLIFYPGGESLALKHRQLRLFDPASGAEIPISRSSTQDKPYEVPVSLYRKESVKATWVTIEAAAPVRETSALELTIPSG